MEKKQEEKTLFIVDDSVLIKMLEGIKPETEALEKLSKLKAVTTMSALLRAIYESSEIADMSKLKDILETIEIYPSTADYKEDIAVREEIIVFARHMTEKAKPGMSKIPRELVHYSLITVEKYISTHFKESLKNISFSEKRRIVSVHQDIKRFEFLLAGARGELSRLLQDAKRKNKEEN